MHYTHVKTALIPQEEWSAAVLPSSAQCSCVSQHTELSSWQVFGSTSHYWKAFFLYIYMCVGFSMTTIWLENKCCFKRIFSLQKMVVFNFLSIVNMDQGERCLSAYFPFRAAVFISRHADLRERLPKTARRSSQAAARRKPSRPRSSVVIVKLSYLQWFNWDWIWPALQGDLLGFKSARCRGLRLFVPACVIASSDASDGASRGSEGLSYTRNTYSDWAGPLN